MGYPVATALFLSACMLAGPALPACVGPSDVVTPEEWERLTDEIAALGPLEETSLSIGAQRVYRIRAEGEAGRPDPLLARLSDLKPRIEALQREMPTTPERPVVLMESHVDDFQPSRAFTSCAARGETHWLQNTFTDFDALPNEFCLVVTFPERIDGDRFHDFVLSHEWMHMMQPDPYGQGTNGAAWWREASADWFGHKVVSGATERDPFIAEFFDRQETCSLTGHSYDAQVFFFWGEGAFDTRWVFEFGHASGDHLLDIERVARVLPPDRWLDWAIAQADQTIRMPDGRPLPAQVQRTSVYLGADCKADIAGPALSVQVRDVSLPDAWTGPLTIEPNGARVAIKSGDAWTTIDALTVIDAPPATFTLAAIAPSATDLSVGLYVGSDTASGCACFVGRWMERPGGGADLALDQARSALEALQSMGLGGTDGAAAMEALEAMSRQDRLRFRNEFLEIGAEVRYAESGPVLTIRPDGRFDIDDPHSFREGRNHVIAHTHRHSGAWHLGDGFLELDIQRHSFRGEMEGPMSDGPQPYSGRTTSFTAQSFEGGGGRWTPMCEGDRLTLTPWDPNGWTATEPPVTLVRH